MGIEQSRRDDLESIGFMLIYFLKGKLPWQGLPAKTKQGKYDAIKDKKASTSIETLCEGFPEEFAIYLNYCRKLGFEEKPDYIHLRKLFKNLLSTNGIANDYLFDWIIQTYTPEVQHSAIAKKAIVHHPAGNNNTLIIIIEEKREEEKEPIKDNSNKQRLKVSNQDGEQTRDQIEETVKEPITLGDSQIHLKMADRTKKIPN